MMDIILSPQLTPSLLAQLCVLTDDHYVYYYFVPLIITKLL